MKIKKNLILLLLLGVIVACNKEMDLNENNDNHQPIEYSFVKMEYIISDQSESSEYNENIPKIESLNRTSIIQTYQYNALNGIYTTSQFSGIDSSVINHIINSPIIATPIDIDSVVYLGDAIWPISNTTEKLLPNISMISDILINPNQKLIIETKIRFRKISTNTRLTLIDSKENKEHVFKGKWIGVFPINADTKITFTEL